MMSGSQMESFFVETDSARDPHQNTRQRISQTLEVTPDARILLYGHRGCGKSTELNKLLAEIGERFIPVSFSIMDEMQLVAARAEDLVLVITYRILKTAQKHQMRLKDTLLQPVLDFFSETVLSEKECRDGTFTGGGGPQTIEQLYERLIQCSQQQQKGEKPGLIADPINQILIKSCAMVEYNGER